MKAFVFLLLVGAACAAPSLYTPEVAAARAEFEAAYAAAALAAEQNVLPEVVHPEAVYGEYTDEVATAREEFMGIYNAAFLAASQAIAEVKEAAEEEQKEEAVINGETETLAVADKEPEAAVAEVELEAAPEEPMEVAAETAPVEETAVVVELEAAAEEPLEIAAEPAPVEDTAAEAELEAAVEETMAVAVEAAPLVAPEPVTDTEEVALAKKEFAAAYEAALAAITAGALPEVIHPEGAPAPVEDTAEVADAKAKFAIAFKAAADAAEAAADVDLDGSLSRFSGQISPLLTNTFPFGAYGVHAPLVHSVGKVIPAASTLTLKSAPFHFSPFAPSFAFVKA